MSQHIFPYKRVIVFGSTGAGKSTLVEFISQKFGLPIINMDTLSREAGKSKTPEETFALSTIKSIENDSWILDGSYAIVQDIVWPRAEAIVWLDYSGWIVMWRLFKRSLYRIFLRKKSERPGKARIVSADKRTQTYLRSVFTHNKRRQQYFATLYKSKNRHLHIIRLCGPKDAEKWLELFEN